MHTRAMTAKQYRRRLQRRQRIAAVTERLEDRRYMAADVTSAWVASTSKSFAANSSAATGLEGLLLWQALSRGGSRGGNTATSSTPIASDTIATVPTTPTSATTSSSSTTGSSSSGDGGVGAVLSAIHAPLVSPQAAEGEDGNFDVRYRVELQSASGTPITELTVGDQFQIAVFVEDIRTGSGLTERGVFSAYVDVTFDGTRAELTAAPVFSSSYVSGQSGTSAAGLIDEAGALGQLAPLGTGEKLIFKSAARATSEGVLSVALNAADQLPLHETAVYGNGAKISADRIEYVSDSLQVKAQLEAFPDTVNYTGAGANQTINVLTNDIVRTGPGTITQVGATNHGGTVTIASGGGAIQYRPANGFVGSETFTYTLANTQGSSVTATVTVNVAAQSGDRDLVAFAKALTAANVKFYGAGWCPHCNAQKALFEDGKNYLPFFEVTNPDHSRNALGIEKDIQTYPTWEFADGSRLEGERTLEELATKAGITIPTGVSPTLVPIDDVTLLEGSPLHIPLDGYDPNAGPLTYTISVANPALLTTSVLSGNRSIRFNVKDFGSMTFELFEQEAPRATSRMIELAQDGFYEDIIFHRIIKDFMIQGGDPNGTGTGGSSLGRFDDQFDVDLQHNRSGVLSMAKSLDDTNNSQFFITAKAATANDVSNLRNLDFNHTVFGQLVEGDDVRGNIAQVPTSASNANPANKPTTDVVILSATVFDDIENALARLTAAPGARGTTEVTVTVTDSSGNSSQQSFDVTVAGDTFNGTPYLKDITAPAASEFPTAITFPVETVDVEGDAVKVEAVPLNNGETRYTVSYSSATKTVSVLPVGFYAGKMDVVVYAYPESMTAQEVAFHKQNSEGKIDRQIVTVSMIPLEPNQPFMDQTTDSGLAKTDRITNITAVKYEVSGVFPGATAELYIGDQKVGEASANDTGSILQPLATVNVTTNLSSLADGVYTVVPKQRLDGLLSDAGPGITVTLDRTAPVAPTTLPTTAKVGENINFNVNHPEEGTPVFLYSLANQPTGMTIDQATGVITWTPTAAQVGSHAFKVIVTDPAGNARETETNVSVTSGAPIVRFRLDVADLNGNSISTIASGSEFLLRAYTEDISSTPAGVFSAYFDAQYNSQLVSPTGSLVFSSDYANTTSGSLTEAGLIDEAGGIHNLSIQNPGDEKLVWTLRMRANAVGTASFTGNPADVLPLHEVVRFNVSQPVAAGSMEFVGDQLTIAAGLVAQADVATVAEDAANTLIDVLANDSLGPAGGTLTISQVGTPNQSGTATIVDNKIQYKPAANFVGTETVSYTVSNGQGNTAQATLTVTVTSVNDLPTANDDTAAVDENSQVDIDVRTNDSAAPDTGETLTVTTVTNPTSGTATIQSNGTVRYKPNANFRGTDSFTYTLSDGNGGTDTATVTVTITEVNDPPVATADAVSVNEDSSLTINVAGLLSNDTPGPTDEASQTLTITAVTAGANGAVVLNANNTITFTPAANFNGTTTFTYTVRDSGIGTSGANPKTATGTVTVTVNSVNDNPDAVNDTYSVNSSQLPFTANLLSNDVFTPDTGETLTITNVTAGSQGGTLTVSADKKTAVYQRASGFTGTETFTYTISDGNGGTDQATASFTVAAFTPGSVTGKMFIDANGNGSRDASEALLAGVEVKLQGTDRNGQAVNRSAVTDATGNYTFAQVVPGNYTVVQTQPSFLSNSGTLSNSITFAVNDAGTVSRAVDFMEQGLLPQYSIWEALASHSKNGIMVGLNSSGASTWSRIFSGWSRFASVTISRSANGSQYTITGTESGGLIYRATVSASDTSRIALMGTDSSGNQLVRIRGESTAFTFTQVTGSGTASAVAADAAFAADTADWLE